MLLQIAVLFMAAHKQIVATTHQDKDGNSINAMEVIQRRISDVMLYPNQENKELPMKPNNGFSFKKHKVKLKALASGRIMFQLIEKIGDSLCEFRQTVHSEVLLSR